MENDSVPRAASEILGWLQDSVIGNDQIRQEGLFVFTGNMVVRSIPVFLLE